jgi:hypothetical protein
MRAQEFLSERNNSDNKRMVDRRHRRDAGKLKKNYDHASTGAYTSTEMDRYYDLYRAGMLMGRAPGDLTKIDPGSWLNNRGYMGYYTDAEREKIESALAELDLRPEVLIEPGSQEPPGGNTASPVRSFKGYPR